MKAKEEKDTEMTDVSDDESTSSEEVQLPIVPIESDATPSPPAETIEAQELPVPQVASIDLTEPILEVLTDPTM